MSMKYPDTAASYAILGGMGFLGILLAYLLYPYYGAWYPSYILIVLGIIALAVSRGSLIGATVFVMACAFAGFMLQWVTDLFMDTTASIFDIPTLSSPVWSVIPEISWGNTIFTLIIVVVGTFSAITVSNALRR